MGWEDPHTENVTLNVVAQIQLYCWSYSQMENSREKAAKSSMLEAMIEGHTGCWGPLSKGSSNPDWEGEEKESFLADPWFKNNDRD